jgi:hypothetical protein
VGAAQSTKHPLALSTSRSRTTPPCTSLRLFAMEVAVGWAAVGEVRALSPRHSPPAAPLLPCLGEASMTRLPLRRRCSLSQRRCARRLAIEEEGEVVEVRTLLERR